MTVIQLTTVSAIWIMAMTLTNGQSNETQRKYESAEVWCPQHTKKIVNDNSVYQQCEPHLCIYFNDNSSEVVNHNDNNNSACPDVSYKDFFLSPSCHRWVRLRRDDYFRFDLNNRSIYEIKTNLTHHLGTYVYNPDLKEAFICRKKLLPGDDTEDITLWCSSHVIYTDGPPKIQKNGSLHVPQLGVTLRKGFYKVNNHSCNSKSCEVTVCLNMSMDLLKCEGGQFTPIENNGTPFEILLNLSLLVKWKISQELYPVGHYYITSDNRSATVCVEDVKPTDNFTDNVYPLYIVSAIFCFFTLLAHVFFPKLNYHAKALLCYVVSMMVMYICLAVKRFHPFVESEGRRFSLFILYYVSTMSTYLWLSVIAYEVWKVFANLRGLSRVLESEREKKRWFAAKCGYAWGIPLVLCLLIIGLAHNPKAAEFLEIELVKHKASSLRTHRSVFVFLYGPAIVILLANMVFFGLTIWTIRQASTGTKSFGKKYSRNLLHLSIKLFVVMGIGWVVDVISFLTSGGAAVQQVFYLSHVVNGLQGVAVFLVYVCKKSTWRMMRRKCGATYIEATSETKTSEFSRSRMASTDGDLRDGDRNKPIPKEEVPIVPLTQ